MSCGITSLAPLMLKLSAGMALFLAATAAGAAPTVPTTQPTQDDLPATTSGLEDIELLNLQVPTVITGTRTKQSIESAPYAVSVVTAQDIRDAGAHSIPDALRLVPGVDVAQLTTSEPAVSPRGMTRYRGNQVLVLVDGRQLYDSMFGGTEWTAWPFQLEDIERIEVIRGTGGVTWGTNSINGVINIVTKDPIEQLGLTTTAGGGSRGWTKEHAGYGFADEKLRMRVSGEWERTDGSEHGGTRLFPIDGENNAGRAGVHAIYDAGPQDHVLLSGGSAIDRGGSDASPFSGYRSQRQPEAQGSFMLGRWTHDVERDNSYNVTAYVNDLGLTQAFHGAEFRYDQFALQLSHTLKPADDHTLTWGIDTRAEYLAAAGADPRMMTRDYAGTGLIGLYAQDDWKFAPRWALNIGARIDYEFYNGFQPSGRIALSYELAKDSQVYAAVSDAFMLPTVGDRFQDESIVRGLAHMTSHVDMSPTTALTYELGYRGKLFDRLETTADLFWNEYNDWQTIKPAMGPPGLLRLDYDSRASASMYGFELGLKYPVTRKLTLLGNYTFEELDWRGAMHPSIESDINTPPRHKFMVGTRYSPTSDLHLSSYLYYVDAIQAPNSSMPLLPRHIPTYFRLDLRAEYEFWKKQASIAVGVKNLLEPNHREGGTLLQNDAEVPRTIYAEYRMTIR